MFHSMNNLKRNTDIFEMLIVRHFIFWFIFYIYRINFIFPISKFILIILKSILFSFINFYITCDSIESGHNVNFIFNSITLFFY